MLFSVPDFIGELAQHVLHCAVFVMSVLCMCQHKLTAQPGYFTIGS